MTTYHIIGSGIAGLAAASTLVKAGKFVQIYEAASHAGGKLALLRTPGENDGIDGNHSLVFGGNSNIIALAEMLGSGNSLKAIGFAGESYDALMGEHHTRRAFLLPPAAPLLDWLQWLRLHTTRRHELVSSRFYPHHPLYDSYIKPLCRSLMLTDPEQVNARALALRQWRLIKQRSSSLQVIMPEHSWYRSLIEPALKLLQDEGNSIYFQHNLQGLCIEGGKVKELVFARTRKAVHAKDVVICALPLHATQKLLAPHAIEYAWPQLEQGQQVDIIHVHFMRTGITGLRAIPVTSGLADWIRLQRGTISAVMYKPEHRLQWSDAQISTALWKEVRCALRLPSNSPMPEFRVVRARKAHIRRSNHTPAPDMHIYENLLVTGEYWADARYTPLEACIDAGCNAASLALRIHQ